MYVANHYVRINHTVLTAGEILPDGLPGEKIAWLLRAGAIREIQEAAPVEANAKTADPAGAQKSEEERQREAARENYAAQLAALGYHPDGTRIADTESEEPPEEEIDEEAEPEEIDVMAGIVHQEKQEDAEAARKSGKRGGRRSK